MTFSFYLKNFLCKLNKIYDTVFLLKKEFSKSSLVLYLGLVLVIGSLTQISSTNFFENNDHTLMKITSIYAQDDDGGGDDGGGGVMAEAMAMEAMMVEETMEAMMVEETMEAMMAEETMEAMMAETVMETMESDDGGGDDGGDDGEDFSDGSDDNGDNGDVDVLTLRQDEDDEDEDAQDENAPEVLSLSEDALVKY